MTNFPKSVQNGVLICDIIETEKNIKQQIILECLQQMNFSVYKKYHMWECADGKFKTPRFHGLEIADETDLTRLSNIYEIFDLYADMLPVKRKFYSYINSMKVFSVFLGGNYAGSQIYKVEGSTAIGEYVYAMKGFDGTGGILTMALLDKCFNEHKVKKVFTWICDDNFQSMDMMKSAGFTQTGQYKVIMMRNRSCSF